MTPEQRMRKNGKDRERRARMRAERLAKTGNADAGNTHTTKCGDAACRGSCRGSGRCRALPSQMTADDVFAQIGRLVVQELVSAGTPVAPVAPVAAPCRPAGNPVQVEPGVVTRDLVLGNGTRAKVVVVDGDVVDPLSDRSPLPYPVKCVLLASRMAHEIARIVDARNGLAESLTVGELIGALA